MSSSDDAIYKAEAGGVLARLGGEVAQQQRRSEGIYSMAEAANVANSQAAAEATAQTEAEAGVGSGVAGAIGLGTGVVRGLIKAKRAATALRRVKGFLADKARPGVDEAPVPENSDPSRVRLAGEEPGQLGAGEAGTQPTLQAGTTADVEAGQSAANLRGVQGQMRAAQAPSADAEPPAAEPAAEPAAAPEAPRPPADWLGDDAGLRDGPAPTQPEPATLDQTPGGAESQNAWDSNYRATANRTPAQAGLSDAQANPVGDAASDVLDAGKQAASNLGDQLATKAASATDFLETAASKLGLKGANLSDLLGSSAEDLGELTGGVGADLAGGSGALVAAGGVALEALGPLSMFAGAGLGIYSAIEEGNQETTAKNNAEKYAADVTALSAAPELKTGSIAMPVMDATAFRSGGSMNF